MASQRRAPKPRTRVDRNTRTEVIDQETKAAQRRQEAKDIAEAMDEVLDDIDEVLEENAQEFVRGFVQKGGE